MKAFAEQIVELDGVEIYGRVVGVKGLMVEVAGPLHAMSIGARVRPRSQRHGRADRWQGAVARRTFSLSLPQYPFRNAPPPAHKRQRVGAPLDLGVRALNTCTTCCRGQPFWPRGRKKRPG